MPSVANCAAMCRSLNPTSNKLQAVNWSAWVFRSGVRGGLGNFAPGWWTPGADRRGAAGDSDRLQCPAIGVGRSGSRPAPIQQNQGFGAIRLGIVAPGSSQRASGLAEISRSWGACRLIACLPTRCSSIAISAASAWTSARGRGGAVPPFGSALVSYAGSGHRAGNLESSAPARACALPSALGRAVATVRQGRNVCRAAMGSGVWSAAKRSRSGARNGRRGGNRVGVKTGLAGHAGAVVLGDSAVTVGAGRG